MKLTMPHFVRDSSPTFSAPDFPRLLSRSLGSIQRRGLAPTSLALIIIIPVVCAALAIGAALTVFLRRRRRRRLHQNSPTTSMVRNSLEEDLESYRQERQRMGDVIGAGVSQEGLENQLRGRDHRMSACSGITGAGSRRSSRNTNGYGHEPYPKSELEGWYSPPTPAVMRGGSGPGSRAASRDPSRVGSRPASGLRNSVQADTSSSEKELRGYYESDRNGSTGDGRPVR